MLFLTGSPTVQMVNMCQHLTWVLGIRFRSHTVRLLLHKPCPKLSAGTSLNQVIYTWPFSPPSFVYLLLTFHRWGPREELWPCRSAPENGVRFLANRTPWYLETGYQKEPGQAQDWFSCDSKECWRWGLYATPPWKIVKSERKHKRRVGTLKRHQDYIFPQENKLILAF